MHPFEVLVLVLVVVWVEVKLGEPEGAVRHLLCAWCMLGAWCTRQRRHALSRVPPPCHRALWGFIVCCPLARPIWMRRASAD